MRAWNFHFFQKKKKRIAQLNEWATYLQIYFCVIAAIRENGEKAWKSVYRVCVFVLTWDHCAYSGNRRNSQKIHWQQKMVYLYMDEGERVERTHTHRHRHTSVLVIEDAYVKAHIPRRSVNILIQFHTCVYCTKQANLISSSSNSSRHSWLDSKQS